MRCSAALAVFCLLTCLAIASAARPLNSTAAPSKSSIKPTARSTQPAAPGRVATTRRSSSGSSSTPTPTPTRQASDKAPQPSLKQLGGVRGAGGAGTFAPLPLTGRVIYRRGDLEVDDYIEAIYGGVVGIAQADPAFASTGVGGSVGIPFSYEDQGSYDYEFNVGQASIGVGAKGIAATQAKIRNAAILKAAARAQGASTASYSQNRANFNTLQVSSIDAGSLGASGGGYIVRNADNPDDFLATTPELDPLPFGKK